MKKNSTLKRLVCVLPVLIAAGCGGGTTNTTDENIAQLGAANPDEIDPDSNSATPGTDSGPTTRISGRVADGYLQGATVCIDINENGLCDLGEPAAISGAGGSYELDIPADAQDKPIIASVPPEAIDEDTGQAIGKSLVLSTPADRPEFISPITTLVFEELKSNPTLNVEAAEEAVLEALGMSTDDETSLFDDYISEQDDDDQERADRFRHLHQTARVVADMMDEIQDRVEAAAVDGGVDSAGDDATRLAIAQFVRQEVRNLLPEISLAVAEEIIGQQGADGDAGSNPVTVDPDKVAQKLVPDNLEENVLEKIDNIRELGEVQRANMKELLSAGMYWIEVDCEYSPYDQEMDLNEEIEPVEVMLSDEGIPMPIDIPSFCSAEYGHIIVDGEDSIFTQTHYTFNTETGTWEAIEDDINDGTDRPHVWQLSDGQWVPVSGDAPTGPVEFLDDGGAIVSTEQGKLLVYAGELALANTTVHGYLDAQKPEHDLEEDIRGDEEPVRRITDSRGDELFPEDASAYFLNIKRESLTHVLFNWYPSDDQQVLNSCDEFGGNCNVVDIRDDNGFSPLQSIEQLQETAVEGAEILGMMYSHYEDRPIDLRLSADTTADGTLPVSGKATWFMPSFVSIPGIEPAPGQEPIPGDECTPVIDQMLSEIDLPQDESAEPILLDSATGDTNQIFIPCVDPQPLPVCVDETTQQAANGLQNDDVEVPFELDDTCLPPIDETTLQLADDESPTIEGITDQKGDSDRILGTSSWKLIEVDGVVMLEVGIPVPVRHSADELEAASLLLIEHEGFVRRGARLNAAANDVEVMYSEAAFETLRPFAESYVSEQ